VIYRKKYKEEHETGARFKPAFAVLERADIAHESQTISDIQSK